MKDKGIDIVTINPTMVIDKILQPTLNTICVAILQLMNGKNMVLGSNKMGGNNAIYKAYLFSFSHFLVISITF